MYFPADDDIVIRKTFLIAVFTIFLVAVGYAGYTDRMEELHPGFKAPVFTLSHPDDTATIHSLSDLEGRYVLLNFWSSADPVSRMRLKQYDTMVKRLNELSGSIVVLGVNFDRSRRLFDEIVRLDSLDHAEHIFAYGDEARRLISDYRLAEGYRTYLIDPAGHIVATDPTVGDVQRVVSR